MQGETARDRHRMQRSGERVNEARETPEPTFEGC